MKPSNILLDDDGTVYLVDFGAVQYAQSTRTLAVGTAGYMPPEQMLGKAVPQSDLYGLGVTLIRLATRQEPQSLAVSRMRLQWRKHASLSERFSNWIDNLLGPEIEVRYRDTPSALEALSSDADIDVRHGGPVEPAYSLKPVEIDHDKPNDCPVQIWESVDLMICTFPAMRPVSGRNFVERVELMFQGMFDTDAYTLFTQGGAFSLDQKHTLRVHANRNSGPVFTRKLTKVCWSHDGDYELIAHYMYDSNTSQRTIFVTDQRDWAQWVSHNVRRFADAHGLATY